MNIDELVRRVTDGSGRFCHGDAVAIGNAYLRLLRWEAASERTHHEALTAAGARVRGDDGAKLGVVERIADLGRQLRAGRTRR
jgi:hypothetical protein